MNFRSRAVDWVLLLSLTVMWGSAFTLTKVAVSGLPPTVVVAGRLAVACVLLLLIASIVTRRLPAESKLWIYWLLIAFFGNALPFSLISWGQGYIDSGLAGILMAVMPLVVLGLAHYMLPDERMTRYRAAGFLLGFAGVVTLLGPDALAGLAEGGGQLVPMLAVLAGAFSYAIAAILARLRPVSSPLSTAAATTFIATLLMLPVVLQRVDFPRLPEPGAAELLAIVMLGIFSTAIATVVYFRLIKSAGPTFVSQINYLIPVWAVIIGVVFLDETVQRSHVCALLLVLGGILVTQLERRRVILPRQRTGKVST